MPRGFRTLPVKRNIEKELRMKRALCVVAVLLLAVLVVTGVAQNEKHAPTQPEIDFAKQTSDLMTATLFAALVQEFDETTPENVPQGIQSIGLIFNDRNTNMRLVGTFQPLSNNDLPRDSFENTALARALTGEAFTAVEKVEGDLVYRRSIPLSNFRVECAMCHANFPAVPNATDWVGALMLKVPIN